MLPSLNPNISTMSEPISKKTIKLKEKIAPSFNDSESALVDSCLFESNEVSVPGFYLCLHMGLSLSEIMALRYENIDLKANRVNIVFGLKIGRRAASPVATVPREIVIPQSVKTFL